jgi:hypothetical protein
MKIISNLSPIIFTLFAMSCSALSLAAERTPEGFYQTNPGVEGEKNRLCIWKDAPGTYTVAIATIYCAATFSHDCANAKISDFSFSSKFRNGKLTFYKKETGCSINVGFKNGAAVVSQSVGKCNDTFPNEDAGGQYLRKSELADEHDCAP